MLDTTPAVIMQEIKPSEDLRKRHLVNTNRLIRRSGESRYSGAPIETTLIRMAMSQWREIT